MRTAACYLRVAVCVAAASLGITPAVSAQSFPSFTATGGGVGSSRGGQCTIVSAGGVDSSVPVVFEDGCALASGAASASQATVAASAHAVTSGNSVLMHESATAIFRDQVVFTSTDPNATTAIVALNVDFATRVRAGAFLSSANTTGFVQLAGPGFGGFFPFQVTLNSGGSLFFDEGTFTTITGSSSFVDPSTFEQHALLRTASFVVLLNTPVQLDLHLALGVDALDGGSASVDFANVGFPTGIDVFTLPAGVTANAPGSFLVNNRFVPPTPDISVSPTSYDFGQVNLGSAVNTLVTIVNVGGLDLTVTGIGLENGGSSAIAVTQAPTLPAVIHPNGTVDIQLTYTPTTTAGDQAILDIASDDPDQGLIQVGLNGAGVSAGIPPLQQIADILTFIDSSVGNGSLAGSGPGNSGPGRLNALKNMIKAAGDLIHDGFFAEACDQLGDAYQRTDGVPKPPDFVAGPAAAELAQRIQALRASLGCP